MSESSTVLIQRCLDKIKAGDASARDELVRHAGERLERLARKMLRDYPSLKRWEQTGDVLQNALLRLVKALKSIVPPTPKDFFRFAALQMRRELIDMGRHHFGAEGAGAHHASQPPIGQKSEAGLPMHDPGQVTNDPVRIAAWTEFHRKVEGLPEDEREVFDLIWYQALTQEEAAKLIGVSLRTVKYRWRDARLHLAEAMGGELPTE